MSTPQLTDDERARLSVLYAREAELYAHGSVAVAGLDEVGRGSVAGPLTVGACILPDFPDIRFLNDSKQLTPKRREAVSAELLAREVPHAIVHIAPGDVDAHGIVWALRTAMRRAIAELQPTPDTVIVDGNPIGLGVNEITVVKGDAKIACISAASVLAKVARDALMVAYAETYPEYGFEGNKGYASAAHIAAIKRYGLCPLHRRSFCENFLAPTLF